MKTDIIDWIFKIFISFATFFENLLIRIEFLPISTNHSSPKNYFFLVNINDPNARRIIEQGSGIKKTFPNVS